MYPSKAQMTAGESSVPTGPLGKSISLLKLITLIQTEPKEHLKTHETHALPLF